jgi:hypothetical protein
MTEANQQTQQQNRPHPNQAPKDELKPSEVSSVQAAIDLSKDQAKDYNNQIFLAKNYTFKQLLGELISQVVKGHISPQKSKIYLRNWFSTMSDEEKEAFRADRNNIEETVRYYQGVTDTLTQEVPYLISPM